MEQENNIMIDLETLGLKQDAAIISIGAAKFNIETGEILKIYHANIKWESSLKYGNAEPNTVAWWQEQTGPAKEALTKPAQEEMTLVIANFISWMGMDPVVWGNGACFDIAKLEHYFEKVGEPHPWNFKNTRDVRTIDYLGKNIFNYGLSNREFVGVKHHPVDDAVNTAKYVSEIYQQLKICAEESDKFRVLQRTL